MAWVFLHVSQPRNIDPRTERRLAARRLDVDVLVVADHLRSQVLLELLHRGHRRELRAHDAQELLETWIGCHIQVLQEQVLKNTWACAMCTPMRRCRSRRAFMLAHAGPVADLERNVLLK